MLALRRDRGSLHAAVNGHIDERLDGDIGTARELTATDHGHGRQEGRTYLQLPAPEGLPGKEVRCYLSSLPVGLDLFARAARGRRSVENACHWALDVTFREDDSRFRGRVLGANITWLYRFTLPILKQHPDRRMSLIMKRRGCGWSEKFLMEAINALTCSCSLTMGGVRLIRHKVCPNRNYTLKRCWGGVPSPNAP